MERIRRRVDEIVHDRNTAEILKPWYRFLCKRPCFNDNYLATFNRPNVRLIAVSGTRPSVSNWASRISGLML